MRFRSLKRQIFELLKSGEKLDKLVCFPRKKTAGHLIAFLSYPDERIKKRAISALGILVPAIADEDMESARIIMRKLMWNLNDESGGIGWGIPEAMAQIILNHKGLFEEYAHILRSYAKGGGNYLDYEPLQKEVKYALNTINNKREV